MVGHRLGRLGDPGRKPPVGLLERAGDVRHPGDHRARRFGRPLGQALIGLVEGAGDVGGAPAEDLGGLLGARGDPLIGVGQRLLGLLAKGCGQLKHAVAQGRGDAAGAALQHEADVVDAGGQRRAPWCRCVPR